MVALVLLPGMDGTGQLFNDFVANFGDGIRPIIVPYPEGAPLGYQELDAFARNYLPENELFVLLGESFSGPVAISIAASKPSGLIGLILCGTFVSNPAPIFRYLKPLISILPIPSKLTGLIAPFLLGRFSTRKLREALQHVLSRIPANTFRARLHAVLDVNVSDKLKEVQVPMLYLQATKDRLVSASALKKIREIRPDIQVSVLSAPHLLLQVLPTEAAAIVKKFIENIVVGFNPSGSIQN